MAIQVNGCTVIDDDRNIVNAGDIRVGLVTITGSNGNIQTSGTITGVGYSVIGVGYTVFPGAGTTGVDPRQAGQIVLSFPTSVSRGTGTINLRTVSVGGSVFKSYNVATASSITVLNNTFSLNLFEFSPASGTTTPVLPYNKQIFVEIPSTAITGFIGLNTTGADSYSFTTSLGAELGEAFEGGNLICRFGAVNWIAAPATSEVSRNWYCREDASTRAQQVSGCAGWFVPTCNQLQNPGTNCKIYWAPGSNEFYWSSTQANNDYGWGIWIDNAGSCIGNCFGSKPQTRCVRSFRCVTY
jgi:hypothetical protein